MKTKILLMIYLYSLFYFNRKSIIILESLTLKQFPFKTLTITISQFI